MISNKSTRCTGFNLVTKTVIALQLEKEYAKQNPAGRPVKEKKVADRRQFRSSEKAAYYNIEEWRDGIRWIDERTAIVISNGLVRSWSSPA